MNPDSSLLSYLPLFLSLSFHTFLPVFFLPFTFKVVTCLPVNLKLQPLVFVVQKRKREEERERRRREREEEREKMKEMKRNHFSLSIFIIHFSFFFSSFLPEKVNWEGRRKRGES